MRRSIGTTVLLGVALMGSVWLLRESALGTRALWAADRVSHAAFSVAERVFHRGDGAAHEAHVVYEVREQARERGAPEEAEFAWSGRLDQGDVVEVRGLNGKIRAQATDGSEVEVHAIKRSRSGDVSDVRVEVREHAGGITVCAVYDTWDGCDDGNRRGGRNRDVQVEFDIQVPDGVRFSAASVNGGIEVEGGIDDVEASAVNGSVEIESEGSLRAESVNGSVRARLLGAALSGPVHVSTVNGAVELDLPDEANADLEATWVNGSFASDLPVTLQSKGKRNARGLLGAGGERVEVETVNGRIRIH
ncbi:MAG: DUF4097 family beta strand repeat-containing protein [Gemmatimonadota bacterium]|nr:hypothetical protein [Gemmatimonadota bacterium]